jgi:hypothetical protein
MRSGEGPSRGFTVYNWFSTYSVVELLIDILGRLMDFSIMERQWTCGKCTVKDTSDYFSFRSGLMIQILWLWIHDKDNNDTQVFKLALDILFHLDSTTIIHDSKCLPDHAAVGPETVNTLGAMSQGSDKALPMFDRKFKFFADYNHYLLNQAVFVWQHKDRVTEGLLLVIVVGCQTKTA